MKDWDGVLMNFALLCIRVGGPGSYRRVRHTRDAGCSSQRKKDVSAKLFVVGGGATDAVQSCHVETSPSPSKAKIEESEKDLQHRLVCVF